METIVDGVGQIGPLSQFPGGAQMWINDILVWIGFGTVSYTHLTLPTIYSV